MSDLVWETSVATRLGISRDTIRALRKQILQEGDHWVNDRGRIWVTPLGILAIEDAIKAGAPLTVDAPAHDLGSGAGADTLDNKNAPTEPIGAEPEAPGVHEMRVIRTELPNWRVIHAQKADGERVFVRTNSQTQQTSRHWLPGMLIRAVFIDGGWQQVGRSPRFRGRY